MVEDLCNEAVSVKSTNVKTHSLWELIEIDALGKKKVQCEKKINKCNKCEHEFASKSALARHLRRHSGKLYKCNQCDYASSCADNLKLHLKMHSGNRSNKCSQCDYASIRASYLRNHREHTVQRHAPNVTLHPVGQGF